MKKIFSALALAAFALSSFAQATQEYMRVEFTVPMTEYDEEDTGKTGTALAAGQKDNYIYVNPRHQYLDFNVTEHPLTFRSTTTSIDGKKSMYLHQIRNTQSNKEDNTAKYPYDIDYISSITQYSIPVEKVELIDSVPAKEVMINSEKSEKAWRISEFRFNRLPRNVAELKTLIEPNGDGVRTHCHNPEFIVAVGYLIAPRLLDCSQDCRDMFDYLCGKWDGRNVAFSNADFQDLCISSYSGGGDGENGGGKDSNGVYWDNNHAFQWFDGALPSNQYLPNGKSYDAADGPFKVYVCREVTPMAKDRYFLISHPYDTNRANRAMDSPDACVVFVAKTNQGFYLDKNMKNYFARGKAQVNPDL